MRDEGAADIVGDSSFISLRSRRQHKAWGGAKRNPRESLGLKKEPTKWATVIQE